MLTHIVRQYLPNGKAYELQAWYTDGRRRPASATGAMTSKIKGQDRKVTWSVWAVLAQCCSCVIRGRRIIPFRPNPMATLFVLKRFVFICQTFWFRQSRSGVLALILLWCVIIIISISIIMYLRRARLEVNERSACVIQLLLTTDSVKVHKDVLSQVAVLRRLRHARLSESQATQLCQVLDTLSGHCQTSRDALHANTINQNIITSHCESPLYSAPELFS